MIADTMVTALINTLIRELHNDAVPGRKQEAETVRIYLLPQAYSDFSLYCVDTPFHGNDLNSYLHTVGLIKNWICNKYSNHRWHIGTLQYS